MTWGCTPRSPGWNWQPCHYTRWWDRDEGEERARALHTHNPNDGKMLRALLLKSTSLCGQGCGQPGEGGVGLCPEEWQEAGRVACAEHGGGWRESESQRRCVAGGRVVRALGDSVSIPVRWAPSRVLGSSGHSDRRGGGPLALGWRIHVVGQGQAQWSGEEAAGIIQREVMVGAVLMNWMWV